MATAAPVTLNHGMPPNGAATHGGLCYFRIDVASCAHKADIGSIMMQ